MENNDNNNLDELEQLKAQYETLKRQFDQQEIVNDSMLSNATKKSISKLQRELLVRIIIMTVLTPLIVFELLGIYFLPWCLGIIALNLYIYLKTKKINSESLNVADYVTKIHKMIKFYKIVGNILGIFFSLFLLILGTVVLISLWPSIKGIAFFCGCILADIAIVVIYHVIDKVFIKSDVEITLEGVLKDLEQ